VGEGDKPVGGGVGWAALCAYVAVKGQASWLFLLDSLSVVDEGSMIL
jgi:hypothetical protein